MSHARIASKSLVISYSNFSAAIALYLRQKMGGQLWVMGRRAVCFSEARVGPASRWASGARRSRRFSLHS
jgi:hypothetical protein